MDDASRNERNLIEAFKVVRSTLGISDEEFGKTLDWQSDDVADFDSMDDGKITLCELAAVAKALRLRVTHRFEAVDDSPEATAAMSAFEEATKGMGE